MSCRIGNDLIDECVVSIVTAGNEMRVGQRQVGHATGGDAPAGFDRMNKNDKFNGAIKGLEPRTIAAKARLPASQAEVAKLGLFDLLFKFLLAVLL